MFLENFLFSKCQRIDRKSKSILSKGNRRNHKLLKSLKIYHENLFRLNFFSFYANECKGLDITKRLIAINLTIVRTSLTNEQSSRISIKTYTINAHHETIKNIPEPFQIARLNERVFH